MKKFASLFLCGPDRVRVPLRPAPARPTRMSTACSAQPTSALWVSAFNNATTLCDQNNDGSCTPADFSARVANYNAGCDFTDSDGDRIPNIYENNTGNYVAGFATGPTQTTRLRRRQSRRRRRDLRHHHRRQPPRHGRQPEPQNHLR